MLSWGLAVSRTAKDVEELLEIEFDAGRAGVVAGQAKGEVVCILARLAAGGNDPEVIILAERTIALVEDARSRAARATKRTTNLIDHIRDRERKQRSRR